MKGFIAKFMVVAFLLVPFSAFGSDYAGHFGDMDKNNDDLVSWEEFLGYFPNTDRETFDRVDADKNESIDHDEWHHFKKEFGYGHGENKVKPGGQKKGSGEGQGKGTGEGCS